MAAKKFIPPGTKFGFLTVLGVAVPISHGDSQSNCLCDCGKSTNAINYNLKNGHTTSCGCKKYRLKHGALRNGQRDHHYSIWCAMIARCGNPTHESYPNYGGRGIKVCERWSNSYANFIADVGVRPSNKHSLDRIDNSSGYSPGNCRWVTRDIQNRNSRRARLITFNGETKCLTDWSVVIGISQDALRWRLDRGQSIEAIISSANMSGGV